MEDFGSSHERYLAGYRTSIIEVWCSNKECSQHTQSVAVRYEEEYGQGWLTPEQCDCGGTWLYDRPEDEDDE